MVQPKMAFRAVSAINWLNTEGLDQELPCRWDILYRIVSFKPSMMNHLTNRQFFLMIMAFGSLCTFWLNLMGAVSPGSLL